MLVNIVNVQALTEEVTLVVGNDDSDSTVLEGLDSKVKIRFFGRSPGSRNPWYILKLIHTIKHLNPDIIHAHQASFSKVLRWLTISKVLTVHHTNADLELVDEYDAVYSISDAVRLDIKKHFPNCQTSVVPNGICFSAVRHKTSYGQSPFRIVQVSRLDHEKKGQDVLLKALQYLTKTIEGGRVLVDFIGEGKSRAYLAAFAEELGVAQWCRLLGQRPQTWVHDNLMNYDLLVQPSRHEGFGLTVVEAMAARVPVLVSNVEGPMEIVQHGKYGYCFQTEDHVDCGNKIAQIMRDSHGETFPEELYRNAEYAKSRFEVAITAKQYLAEYEKVIQRITAV